ncbi:MAG: hypothetical protein OEW52_00880 [Thermoleophilia bacterium]|nr:hypothetical protein [Thermoleophilia bacterium]MDH4338829.1 hypothetical protein [Thermoleophilia bacterium]MDH5279682.1 hypothetical protein [Thermoleophilia bacterium]
MNRDLGRALRALIAPTVALFVVLVFIPGRLSLAVRIYGLLVCAVALALALSALRRSYPRARRLRPRRRQQPASRRPPPGLARIEHETALGVAGAFDLHFRLVPRIRAIAAGLLASRRSVSQQAAPDTARNILGSETWELVRADRPPPDDRLARGLPVLEMRSVVESLERI